MSGPLSPADDTDLAFVALLSAGWLILVAVAVWKTWRDRRRK